MWLCFFLPQCRQGGTVLKPILQNNFETGQPEGYEQQAVRGKVFWGFCGGIKQLLYQVSHCNICSSLASIFGSIMLTKKVQSAGNNCMPQHQSEINIYDVCALNGARRLEWGKKFDSERDEKRHSSLSLLVGETINYVGAGSVSGSSYGHFYLHNLSSYKRYNWYGGHVGGRPVEPFNPPRPSDFRGPTWHLASSRLGRQLLWTTKWLCVIPLLVSKPFPDSWLVNSACNAMAKRGSCCQSWGSHVETPGKVIELEAAKCGRGREETGVGRGRGGLECQAFYMQLLCIRNDYLPGK